MTHQDLATIPDGGLPPMSQTLAVALETEMQSDPRGSVYAGTSPDDPGFVLEHRAYRQPTQPVIDEAMRALPAFEAALEVRVSHDGLRRFLGHLNASVRNPQDANAFRIRVDEIFAEVADMPAMLFSRETLAVCKRACDWWPSVAALLALLEAPLGRLMRQRWHLREMARHGVRHPQRVAQVQPDDAPMSDEERASMLERFAALKAELRGADRVRHAPDGPVRLSTISNPVLAAIYRQQAGTLRVPIDTRLAMMGERA